MDPRIEKILRFPLYIKALVITVFCMLLGGSFFFVFFEPTQQEFVRLQEQAQKLESKLRDDRKIAADLPRFRDEYEKLKARLDEALMELPNEKEIPGLLTSIATLAKNQGLDILSFIPKGEIIKDFYAEVPVEMKLSGSFHDVALFFDSIGQLPRIININNLDLDKPKTVDGKTVLSISCLATTYRFVDKPAPVPEKTKKKKK